MNNLEQLIANHRVDSRYAPKEGTEVTCRRPGTPEGADLALSLVDLTDIGVGLAVSESVEKGEVVEVGLRAPGWAEPIRRPGLVVWSEAAGSDGWRIGVVFAAGLNFPELEALCRLPAPGETG